jgi:hypothetical protein
MTVVVVVVERRIHLDGDHDLNDFLVEYNAKNIISETQIYV